MPLAPGTKFGPYEIQPLLGAGGMGEVYRARDTRLDRAVAIKILASHLSSSPELKQRMEREARSGVDSRRKAYCLQRTQRWEVRDTLEAAGWECTGRAQPHLRVVFLAGREHSALCGFAIRGRQ
jgi:hypothetical protein